MNYLVVSDENSRPLFQPLCHFKVISRTGRITRAIYQPSN